jgi:23S rRNA (adenine2503-C2)-methyltransferase
MRTDASPAPNLLAFVPEELAAWSTAAGHPLDVPAARQILSKLITAGRQDPTPTRRAVRKEVLEHLRRAATWERPVVEERVVDPDDGSVRYLFKGTDGARFEAVRISLHKPGKYTVCLSSQAGCAMACAFCATGRLGLARHLTAAEIVGQFVTVRDEAAATGRVSGAVFMGQGEPLHNYDEVIRAARVLSNPAGGMIAQENITISTVGLVSQLRRYTAEGHDYKLIVSLTSALPDRRRELLPVAGKVPFDEVVAAIREHAAALKARSKEGSVGQRMTVAWVLLGGVNHGDDEVDALARHFDGLPVRVNVIDVNDARPDGFRRATDDERRAFTRRLGDLGMPVVRRYSVGRNKHSACGMLAGKRLAELAAES